ncbi:MAG: hypothetical protein H6900_01545 [Rhodobacter sp.]|uniref:hypothetical protein n=1 Tax=Pararhodobacter sp. TaxID=2127056 RepID=UPI001D540776|nr:hypothetical protein [Pararhodobacter sp.]MCB1345116.1 hypothetical protein [Paracoccaceae bacterium]MCC0071951.1 hypothetical protein [Rhodobacter sp.]HPD91782.1 hypothetical protein [Pararhodobacter sp.]
MAGIDARAVYEAHLRAASRAAFSGDLRGLLARFAIPSQIAMADRSIVITSSEELDLALQDYVHRLQAEGITDEREWCDDAVVVRGMPDLISGRHTTEWHFGDGRPPRRFGNRMVLLRHPEGWKLLWLRSDLACDEMELLSAEFVAAQALAFKPLNSGRRRDGAPS